VATGGSGYDRLTTDLHNIGAASISADFGSMVDGHKVRLSANAWISGFEAGRVVLTSGADWISLGQTQFDVLAGAGDDTIVGGAFGDRLDGETGTDVVSGEGGDDEITGTRGDRLDGGAGQDVFHLMLQDNSSTVDTGIDVDFSSLATTTVAFEDGTSLGHFETGEIVLDNGDNRVVIGDNAITVVGGNGADYIEGGSLDDSLTGGWGSDTLLGLGGDDWLFADDPQYDAVNLMDGGEGDDHLVGGYGDTLIGGDGVDTFLLYLNDNTALLDVELSSLTQGTFDWGPTHVTGFEGGEVWLSWSADRVIVGELAATVHGWDGADTITGGARDDVIFGDDGRDNLLGGAGADRLSGDFDIDRLTGGAGADTLTGGFGSDTFVFRANDSMPDAPDVITDLDSSDVIDLGQASHGHISLVDAFTGHADQATLRYLNLTDRTLLAVDLDGDGQADMRVFILGDHRDFANFVL
jgi:Ca2+-binding RTX toxin-like protein